MTNSTIKMEFLKAFEEWCQERVRYHDDTSSTAVALWAAKWMAEKLAKEADSKESWDCSHFAAEIRQLSKELE